MVEQTPPIGGRFVMLGEGVPTPTGPVFDASDTQSGGAVALKLVPAAVLPTATMADRALRELKQLAKVTSERIVRILDQGKLPDGGIYVATEKLDGISLAELVAREGTLPVERARAIVLNVGEALTEAQKVGVIHRDVAPRNVLIGPDDRVKVADFGLAEPVHDGGGPGAAKVFGAPAFLSPEQAEGKPVDQRSNIYSLGAMYYFALTGEPPFAGDTPALLHLQLHGTANPPSQRRPDLGADIDRVILKALEKNGGRRHLTLRQLLTEIGGAGANPVIPPGGIGRGTTGEQPPLRGLTGEQPPLRGLTGEQLPVPSTVTAQPQQRAGAGAHTVMGVAASPVAAMGPPGDKSVPHAPSPVVAQPAQKAAPQAATMMGEAPSRPHQAPPQAATVMAEAPVARRPPPEEPARAAPQAATMMAEAPVMPARPAPQAATKLAEAPRAATAAPAGRTNDTGKKKGFRETAWFKRGELEEEMARAQAAAGTDPLKSGTTGAHPPLDDSQVDLSSQDAARLSLKTGATQAMPILKGTATALPGDRMDEAEMLAEITSSRKYVIVAALAAVVIIIGLIVLFATRGGSPKSEAPPPAKPAPMAASPPATATPPPAATAVATAAVAAPPAASPTPPSPAPTPPAAAPAKAPTHAGALADAVEKVESTQDKRELRRLERLLTAELKAARKKRDRAGEATDWQLLARLRRVTPKKR